MSNPIVTVNATQLKAPIPSALQKSGAFVSQGGTNTSPGTFSLLTQLSDLTPLLPTAKAITSLAWSANVVTATTTSPHGYTTGDTLNLTIAGAAPAGYNGTFLCTITGASTFTYPLLTNPGSETLPGTYIPGEVASIVARATTFFAQGSSQAVWVLECGAGNANDGVTFLSAWITANPGTFYSYLVPRYWDGNANFLAMLASFEAVTSQTYFFITTTLATWQLYTALMKCAFTLIEAPKYGIWPANVITVLSQSGGLATATTTSAHGVVPGEYFQLAGNSPAGWNGWFLALPGTTGTTLSFNVPSSIGVETALGTLVASQYASTGIPATEFSCAAPFRVTLNYAPSSTNRVTPLNQAYLFGVTPFSTQGNAALLATLNNGNINVVGTGAQGGISETLLVGGNTMDGNPFNYWYAADYAQINGQQVLTAAVINGSNNPQNPLYYNQPGINTLQQSVVTLMNNMISYGLCLEPVKATTLSAEQFLLALDGGTYDGFTTVNADPFASYTAENPSDYSTGTYNGISVEFTPLRGFGKIVFNLTVANFVT